MIRLRKKGGWIKPRELGVFIDYENVNQLEIIEEIFTYLKNHDYSFKTRKMIMSKLSNVELLNDTIKMNYLQIVVSYKRINNNKNNESAKYDNKNNADFRFYIEVLDCLYQENPDGFVFVSGDKDYTELVLELKKRGKYLIGIGNRANTSEKYVNLFDEFVFCEDLQRKVDLKKNELNKKLEELMLNNEKDRNQEQAKKDKENKKIEQARKKAEKTRIREENRIKNEEIIKQKKEQEEQFINEFGPLVNEFLSSHKPGKYLLSTITSEIKKKNPDKFPKKVRFDIYTKLNFDVKNDTDDKSKAYLEIKEEPVDNK